MSDVLDTTSISVTSADAMARTSAPTMRFAAGLAAATLSVGVPTVAPTFLSTAATVREGASSLRVFDTSGHRAVLRPTPMPSTPTRDFDAERKALDALRAADRRGLVWRGIKSALGLGPRVQATTPDERVSAAVDRVLSVRSRGNH